MLTKEKPAATVPWLEVMSESDEYVFNAVQKTDCLRVSPRRMLLITVLSGVCSYLKKYDRAA